MLAKPYALNIVGFSGSPNRPSRTRNLIEGVIERIAALRPAGAVTSEVFDILDVMPELGQTLGGGKLSTKLEHVIHRLETADAIVVGTPVYKGSYTGLFKHFFDLIEPQRLLGLPVVLTATGGGDRHALVVEHQLRPLFGFFSSHTIATSIYASERAFSEGRIHSAALEQRIDAAVRDLAIWLERSNEHKLASVKVPA
jgi:FMN reductase